MNRTLSKASFSLSLCLFSLTAIAQNLNQAEAYEQPPAVLEQPPAVYEQPPMLREQPPAVYEQAPVVPVQPTAMVEQPATHAEPTRSSYGDNARSWLKEQSAGSQASATRPTLSGAAMVKVYERYIKSFAKEVPDKFESGGGKK